MTPYPEYKATNLPWLPQIPAHWELVKIRELFTERNQKVSDKEYAPLSVSKGGVVPQISTVAKTDNGDNRKLVKVGDFVINSRSDRKGSSGISAYDGSVSLINLVLKPRNDYNRSYLHYLLKSIPFIEEYYKNGRGIVADLWTTRYSEMKTVSIPTPTAAEQEQIVRYLDSMTAKINKLIRAKKKQIALLQEQKQAIINQAVTKGLNPDAEMKDSGIDWLGQIPAHWEVKKAKYCVNINHGSDPVTEGNVPVYGSGAGSFKTCGEFKEGPAVLVGRKGATLHIPHYITGKYWNVDTAFDVKAKKNFFLHFYYFLATCFDYHFYISQTTLPSMTQTDYLNMKLPVPPQKEQYDIIQYLVMQDEKFDNLIAEIKNIINSLFEYKNSLIACVVTGQVDVRNIQVEDFDPADLISETDDNPAEEESTEESEE